MKTENTLITTIKNTIPNHIKKDNSQIIQKELTKCAIQEGFSSWENLCYLNDQSYLKNKINLTGNKVYNNPIFNEKQNSILLVEKNTQLNNEVLKQKIDNKETIIVLADLSSQDFDSLLLCLKTENINNKINIISDAQISNNQEQIIKKSNIENMFLTKHIDQANIRDFMLDMIDINSVWSNKPILLFSSYWFAMNYKMNQKLEWGLGELKEIIQFNKYFELYQELKKDPQCPNHIWLAMENFLRGIPQINLSVVTQKQVVYEQYGYIQMQIMRLINNILAFENNISKKQLRCIFNKKQITIFNIHSEDSNKKEFNLKLYIYLIYSIYKDQEKLLIKKNRAITFNLINVLNTKAIDKLFYLNNNYVSIIGAMKGSDIHTLLRDNFNMVIQE